MNDEQALDVLNKLQPVGLAKTARDIAVNRMTGFMNFSKEVKEMEPPADLGKYYKQGYELCKIDVLQKLSKYRKEQNW